MISFDGIGNLNLSRRLLVVSAAGLFLAGCVGGGGGGGLGGLGGGAPEAQPSRTLTITLSASSNVNPGPDGGASPLPVQVYVLRSTGAFQSQDYFGLKGGGASSDQVDSSSVSLRPGETKQVTVNTGTGGAYLGVIAGYRNIDSANWRATTSIGTSDAYRVSAGRSSISISAR